MVAEHSHKKDGQICAAISKKKREKMIFSKIRESILKTEKRKENWAKKIKTKQNKRTWKKENKKINKKNHKKTRKNNKKITTKNNKTKKGRKTRQR